MESGFGKRKRTASMSDDVDDRLLRSSTSQNELQQRVYSLTLVKLKTAAPLTRSQRRREPPLLRTVLMFNTLRSIEKTSAVDDGIVPAHFAGAGGSGGLYFQSSVGVHSTDLRTHVVAATKDVQMDLLPLLPSEFLFSCSVDRPDADCFCSQSYDVSSGLRLTTPTAESSGVVAATFHSNSSTRQSDSMLPSHQLGGFPSTGLCEPPVIAFSSFFDFDSTSSSSSSSPPPPPSATAARTLAPASEGQGMDSFCDLSFEWPDFDLTPPIESPTSMQIADFDLDFVSFGVIDPTTGSQPIAGTASAVSNAPTATATTCNHRNELLADELERIVQQILVGT